MRTCFASTYCQAVVKLDAYKRLVDHLEQLGVSKSIILSVMDIHPGESMPPGITRLQLGSGGVTLKVKDERGPYFDIILRIRSKDWSADRLCQELTAAINKTAANT